MDFRQKQNSWIDNEIILLWAAQLNSSLLYWSEGRNLTDRCLKIWANKTQTHTAGYHRREAGKIHFSFAIWMNQRCRMNVYTSDRFSVDRLMQGRVARAPVEQGSLSVAELKHVSSVTPLMGRERCCGAASLWCTSTICADLLPRTTVLCTFPWVRWRLNAQLCLCRDTWKRLCGESWKTP